MRPNTEVDSRSYLAARLEAEEQARRRQERKARQTRTRRVGAVVACVLFLAVVGAGWLFGGHAIFAPRGGTVGQAKAERHRTGWVIYELVDGNSCRYHRLDNDTGRVGAGTKAECEDIYTQRRARAGTFTWGGQ